ncbi:DsbE family thiol:disulfide interchange protein [Ancylobacter defluvii]|uniref:Thiol:disulfide interchange protein CycY n=1 Tax=Ancylobacter defluvii TaxID=1282440 RepID=A0A9W6N935_9HYPH|nr:DsbE family thiol:disulfide interchange protein [Ancylobacter defluvii]MBS7587312.1 DsbE family thiol:disulfide interchange protein [Ancylobacter defluvii]GLK82001.1 thiol:disulfide interchange protein CycY [Ancylobacter defluvii]
MAGNPPAEARSPLRRRLLLLLPLALFLALVVLFYGRLFSGDPSRLPSVLIGRPAPALDLPPLEGLARDGVPVPGLPAGAIGMGEVTVLNVFASWCVPCRDEHPFLVQLSQMPGFRLVGLNYKDEAGNARRFLGTFGNPYAAVGVDPNGRAAIEWGVYGVPETFVIGRDGRIAYKYIGPIDAEGLRSRLLPEILKASAAPPGPPAPAPAGG